MDQNSQLSDERKWAIACYIPIFNVVGCALTFARKVDSDFCRFHARQGIVLFILWFLTIVVALFSQILSLMLWGAVILLHIFGVMIALSKQKTKIPIIGQIATKIPEYYFYKLLTGKEPIVPKDESEFIQKTSEEDQSNLK